MTDTTKQTAPGAETIDTPELRVLAFAYSQAIIKGSVPQSSEAWGDLITHIMDWHSARMAAAVDAARVEATRIYMDMLKYRVAAACEQALEEAAKIAMSHNYTGGGIEAARAIRALKDSPASTKPEAVAPVVQDDLRKAAPDLHSFDTIRKAFAEHDEHHEFPDEGSRTGALNFYGWGWQAALKLAASVDGTGKTFVSPAEYASTQGATNA